MVTYLQIRPFSIDTCPCKSRRSLICVDLYRAVKAPPNLLLHKIQSIMIIIIMI